MINASGLPVSPLGKLNFQDEGIDLFILIISSIISIHTMTTIDKPKFFYKEEQGRKYIQSTRMS